MSVMSVMSVMRLLSWNGNKIKYNNITPNSTKENQPKPCNQSRALPKPFDAGWGFRRQTAFLFRDSVSYTPLLPQNQRSGKKSSRSAAPTRRMPPRLPSDRSLGATPRRYDGKIIIFLLFLIFAGVINKIFCFLLDRCDGYNLYWCVFYQLYARGLFFCMCLFFISKNQNIGHLVGSHAWGRVWRLSVLCMFYSVHAIYSICIYRYR